MKDIFIESVNRYSGLDDTRKGAIISLYSTLFEADETKEKKEEPKADNKEEKKEEKKDDKKDDVVESADGDFRIKRNLTPINVTPSPNRPIKYIALHYTAGASSKPGSATRTVFPGNCSADFVVDDGEIYQFSPDLDNYYCHAVGVKQKDYETYMNAAKVRGTQGAAGALIKSANNKNTISIEMCSNFNGTITKDTSPYDEGFTLSEATLANTAKLVSYLLQKYPDAQIVRHFDITGKPCPGPWSRDKNGTATFNAFVNRCKSTPPQGGPQFDDVEDALMPKDERPSWPDFGRFFKPYQPATTTPDEEDASDVSNGDVVSAIKKAVGNPIGNMLIDVITKNSGKVSPYVVKDFVTMITQPKNKEMLKNVFKLVSNQ